MVVLRGDAVLPQDVVQEALEGRLDPRTAGIKEEDRHLRVVRGWRLPASCDLSLRSDITRAQSS